MNTRRPLLGAKPTVPSVTWHLMHEPYHVLFSPAWREHVEDWYNLGATGAQRDVFRDVCSEIYRQPPTPTRNGSDDGDTRDVVVERGQGGDAHGHCGIYSTVAAATEVDLLLSNYGAVLSDEGRRRTRAWLSLTATSRRRRDQFRAVFVACQHTYKPQSVLHTDFTAPEPRHLRVDRTHFLRTVDWNSPPPEPQPRADDAAATRTRYTKPRSQFDGINHLARAGYADDVRIEDAVAQLKAKHAAHTAGEHYYIDQDDYPGCTVCKVGAPSLRTCATRTQTQQLGAMMRAVVPAPMTAWQPKTCE